jgi:rRNA maturation endonuclease Nob1
MAGGMVKDALDEADVNLSGKAETVIMIKCRDCGQLNEEDSKFCQECGVEM